MNFEPIFFQITTQEPFPDPSPSRLRATIGMISPFINDSQKSLIGYMGDIFNPNSGVYSKAMETIKNNNKISWYSNIDDIAQLNIMYVKYSWVAIG